MQYDKLLEINAYLFSTEIKKKKKKNGNYKYCTTKIKTNYSYNRGIESIKQKEEKTS